MQQTGRLIVHGDFVIGQLVYHVTGAPSLNVVAKCAGNIQAGKHPVLLVPATKHTNARALAEELGISNQVTILTIEDFVGMNIIELAVEQRRDFRQVLSEIIDLYNERIAEAETDRSAQIDLD